MNKTWTFLALLLLTGLIAACSSPLPAAKTIGSPVTGIGTPTSEPTPSLLVGTYTTTITQQEIDATHNSRIQFEVQAGGWTLVLRNDGYYTVQTNYHPYGMSYVGEGTYMLTANHMLLKDGNCWEYFGNAGRFGTFMWALQGKNLTFTTVQDECLSRKFVLTVHTWVLQG